MIMRKIHTIIKERGENSRIDFGGPNCKAVFTFLLQTLWNDGFVKEIWDQSQLFSGNKHLPQMLSIDQIKQESSFNQLAFDCPVSVLLLDTMTMLVHQLD